MTAENHNSLSSEIQEIAEMGLPLFPLGAEGEARKRPAILNWQGEATCDLIRLVAWSHQFPGCNWGVLTGPRGRFFVLDSDGLAGEKSLERLIEQHPDTSWMNTAQVVTSRGVQFYFAWPTDITIRNSAGKIGPGLDIRGQGGYVVAPGSRHPDGKKYVWRDETRRMLRAPGWLLNLSQSSEPQKRRRGKDETIPEGERNSTLTSYAGTMRRRDMSQVAIEAALQAENCVSCDPPLSQAEVERIATSISRYDPEPKLILPRRPITRGIDAVELFETALDFARTAPAQTNWTLKPFIPAGGMAELVGKIKASGKTTFAFAMTRSVLNGAMFLTQPCSKAPVVYLTEQPESSLREALARAGLLGHDDLFLLRWHRAMGMPWKELASMAVTKAERVSAKLLVIDTLSQFSQLVGDTENSSGQALEVLRPLQHAQEKGIALLLVRHERKGDAELSDAGRGSSAFAGAVDVLMRLQRLGDKHPATLRRLECLSRFDQTPADSIIELTTEGYVLRDGMQVSLQAVDKKLLQALPEDQKCAKTCLELAQEIRQPRTTVQRSLCELVKSNAASRIGAGIRGLAYRYYQNNPRKESNENVLRSVPE